MYICIRTYLADTNVIRMQTGIFSAGSFEILVYLPFKESLLVAQFVHWNTGGCKAHSPVKAALRDLVVDQARYSLVHCLSFTPATFSAAGNLMSRILPPFSTST